jgi:BirA family biotin operon repressor/biotin-[acetyl-CoA-carboxylase] ligase
MAKDLAVGGAPEGTVVVADEQTAGRGRMGRVWLSPAQGNIYVSVLLRPRFEAEQVFVLTMIFALAAIEGVEKMCGLNPMIKWPNDLYVGGQKLGGILTDFSVKGNAVDYVVLGLGLNVNWNPKEEDKILYPATSILAATGSKFSRSNLLAGILRIFENHYQSVLGGNIDVFYEKWNERSMLLGRPVEIKTTDGSVFGKALRIDRKGALVIEDNKGKERIVFNGDVSLRYEHQDPLAVIWS